MRNFPRLLALLPLLPLLLIAADDPKAPSLGANVSLNGRDLTAADSPWRKDVSHDPVDPNSKRYVAAIGAGKSLHPDFGTVWQGAPMGIPYVVVSSDQVKVPVTFDYAAESDPGPYPIPEGAPIEGGPQSTGDRHILMLDRDNWTLYELWNAHPPKDGKPWHAGSGAIFNLKHWKDRPDGWTSADAAGLPILPGLVRYDEVVEQKAITHAIRFTVVRTRNRYVAPASHFASRRKEEDVLPMGARLRLRADFDIRPYPPEAKVILTALKTYGMILADNGSDWFISGAPDPRWNDEALTALKRVKGSDFEVLKLGELKPKR